MKNWMKMIMIIVIAITILLKSLVMLNLLKFKSKLLTTKWGLLWMWISKLFNNLSICHWAKDCLKKCSWKMNLAMSKSYVTARLFLVTRSVTSLDQLSLAEFSGEWVRPKIYENGRINVSEIWMDWENQTFRVDYFIFHGRSWKTNVNYLDIRVLNCLQLIGFWNFFVFFQFLPSSSFIFETKVKKKYIWVFFPLILCLWFQFWNQK